MCLIFSYKIITVDCIYKLLFNVFEIVIIINVTISIFKEGFLNLCKIKYRDVTFKLSRQTIYGFNFTEVKFIHASQKCSSWKVY